MEQASSVVARAWETPSDKREPAFARNAIVQNLDAYEMLAPGVMGYTLAGWKAYGVYQLLSPELILLLSTAHGCTQSGWNIRAKPPHAWTKYWFLGRKFRKYGIAKRASARTASMGRIGGDQIAVRLRPAKYSIDHSPHQAPITCVCRR